MQGSFGFVAQPLDDWYRRLIAWSGGALLWRRRTPLGQLVKSIISARTRDAVSTAAYDGLAARMPSLTWLADAAPAQVELMVATVTYAESKARYLVAAMRMVVEECPSGNLDHLGDLELDAALAWLERLPGVGRKVSASTLNASTLNRPVLIVDTHVLRVLARLGFVDAHADYRNASEAATAAMPHWTGDDFLSFHIAAKRLGQMICRWDIAECSRCPLSGSCLSAIKSVPRRDLVSRSAAAALAGKAYPVHGAFKAFR